jgi:hypothetical protein
VGTPKSQLKHFQAQMLDQESWTQVQDGVEIKLVWHPDGGADEQYNIRSESLTIWTRFFFRRPSHSGFRSASDPTSQPHVTAVDRSTARSTCYAQRNGQPDRPLRKFGSWRRNQPRDHPGNMPPSHRAVRGVLHLLRPAERSDPTPPLYLPRIQGLSLTSRPSTGPRHVTPAMLSGTVPAPGHR